jgi:hypothetical protein
MIHRSSAARCLPKEQKKLVLGFWISSGLEGGQVFCFIVPHFFCALFWNGIMIKERLRPIFSLKSSMGLNEFYELGFNPLHKFL